MSAMNSLIDLSEKRRTKDKRIYFVGNGTMSVHDILGGHLPKVHYGGFSSDTRSFW